MSAYMIVKIKRVVDRRSMDQYFANVDATFADTGVKPLAVYTPFKLVEGEGPIDGMVLLEFPNLEAADDWYASPGYEAVKHYRLDGAETEIIFLEGGMIASPEDRMPQTKNRAGTS